MSTFPDIGLDPLAYRDQVKGGVAGARERLEKVTAMQQAGVPDQTALVWRIDVDRVLCELTWRSCHLELSRKANEENAQLRSHLNAIGNTCGYPEVADKGQLAGTIIKRLKRLNDQNDKLRDCLEKIVQGGYADGADVAHPAIALAREAIDPKEQREKRAASHYPKDAAGFYR